jgi:hypothetical protein
MCANRRSPTACYGLAAMTRDAGVAYLLGGAHLGRDTDSEMGGVPSSLAQESVTRAIDHASEQTHQQIRSA